MPQNIIREGNGNYHPSTLAANASLDGKVFTYQCVNADGTSKVTLTGTYTAGFSIFNPSNSTVNLYLHSFEMMSASAMSYALYRTTSDPAFPDGAMNAKSLQAASSAMSCTYYYRNGSIPTAPGTLIRSWYISPSNNQGVYEMLKNGEILIAKPGFGYAVVILPIAVGNTLLHHGMFRGFEL